MYLKRIIKREVRIGDFKIGGLNPVAIQSMTNTDTRNIPATVSQIIELEQAGCEIVRIAVKDMVAANAVSQIKKQINIPLVADIHFDYKLALRSIENGIDKLRINPGNIGSKDRVEKIAKLASERGVPIRIGVNSGSLSKEVLVKYGGVTAEALADSALSQAAILESLNFDNIVISIKASSVPLSLKAYNIVSQKTNYPLHIGITEAGTIYAGSVKSAVGLGILLSEGIGDTLRVSLTGNPVEEVKCAKEILKALELRRFGAELVSCPTCGRTEINLINIANKVEEYCNTCNKNIKVAVMGCAVNGPGEAREADIGIAGGRGYGLIFAKGKILRKVPENALVEELIKEIEML